MCVLTDASASVQQYYLVDAPTVVFTIQPMQPDFIAIRNWPIRAPRAGLSKTNPRGKSLNRPCKHTARCHHHLHAGLDQKHLSPHGNSAHYTHDKYTRSFRRYCNSDLFGPKPELKPYNPELNRSCCC